MNKDKTISQGKQCKSQESVKEGHLKISQSNYQLRITHLAVSFKYESGDRHLAQWLR